MLTDSFQQKVPYPTLTDKPNAQTAFQGVVEATVPKAIMTFDSAAARGATLNGTKVKAGMVTFLLDVKRLEYYNGTAWRRVGSHTQSATISWSFLNKDYDIKAIVFDEPFAAKPQVFTNIDTGDGAAARWSSRAYQITQNGFNLMVFATGSLANQMWSGIPVSWSATLSS